MSWSQGELVAAAYAVVFVFVLVYVAIIAAEARTTPARDRGADRSLPPARDGDDPVTGLCSMVRAGERGEVATRPLGVSPTPSADSDGVRARSGPVLLACAVRRCGRGRVAARPAAGRPEGSSTRAERRYAPRVFITFLSDFGLKDDFVGTCHGVMKRIAPETQIIDITHGIPAQSVLQGALVLANTVGFMPVGVHLAIVDPGVGGPRRPLALRDGEGRLYVGPDNGFSSRRRCARGSTLHTSSPTRSMRSSSISRTFHGRDLFSPAAAYLATGVSLEELGPPLDPEALIRLDLPEPVIGQWIEATFLYVDSFGNIALNLDRDDVEALGIVSGTRVELDLTGERYYAVMARTFADARPGDVILYEDSYKKMSIAISRGSAARMLHASPGQHIRITLAG